MSTRDKHRISGVLSSVERAGAWQVPAQLEVRAFWGNVELDLREALLEPGLTTITIDVQMGNVEIIVPPHIAVDSQVDSFAASVCDRTLEISPPPSPVQQPASAPLVGPPYRAHVTDAHAEPTGGPSRIKLVGKVKFGNCEVITLARGQRREEAEWHARHHARHERHHARRERRRRRWDELRAEREMWRRARRDADPDQRWLPWWLMSRMRWRIFLFLAIALGVGIIIGVRIEHRPWWWLVLGAVILSGLSGAIAWRITRPLIMAIRAARDIGDGKLDTRLDPRRHGGEVRLLANAINHMAGKIQQQLSDQRQLLAAVSHELRTPLGHMRVLIETARDRGDLATLQELDREVLVLDDLVGKLLASSRLEFGNLDRRALDLGELVTDVVTAANIAPEAIEAIGDVRTAADPTLLRRAVANLIDNARVHGGGAIAVRIERRANQIAVEVDDAGPGVPADRRADAFRAFVPSSGGGLGLGLALVSRIAVAHGGGAWITDRPGGGARVGFTVEAPPPTSIPASAIASSVTATSALASSVSASSLSASSALASNGSAPRVPESRAPASRAPASRAPASRAPASSAMVSSASASSAPASSAPASSAPASSAPASNPPASSATALNAPGSSAPASNPPASNPPPSSATALNAPGLSASASNPPPSSAASSAPASGAPASSAPASSAPASNAPASSAPASNASASNPPASNPPASSATAFNSPAIAPATPTSSAPAGGAIALPSSGTVSSETKAAAPSSIASDAPQARVPEK